MVYVVKPLMLSCTLSPGILAHSIRNNQCYIILWIYNDASYNGYKSLDTKSPMLKDYLKNHYLSIQCIAGYLYNDIKWRVFNFKKGHSLSEVGGRKFHVYKTISALKRKNHCKAMYQNYQFLCVQIWGKGCLRLHHQLYFPQPLHLWP